MDLSDTLSRKNNTFDTARIQKFRVWTLLAVFFEKNSDFWILFSHFVNRFCWIWIWTHLFWKLLDSKITILVFSVAILEHLLLTFIFKRCFVCILASVKVKNFDFWFFFTKFCRKDSVFFIQNGNQKYLYQKERFWH